MRVLVSGAGGFIGRSLVASLEAAGHEVVRLTRRLPSSPFERYWNPSTGEIVLGGNDASQNAKETFDAVVHLAGESIAGFQWSAAKKERIRGSRVAGTRLLAQAITQLAPRPRVFISASAIGIYGDRGEELLTEESAPGDRGFLVEVARQWEEAAQLATDAGVRVVTLRLGMVLGSAGGALRQMLLPFRLGLGGPMGSGRQYVSWIALADVVRCVEFILETDGLRGPVNCVAPQPVTNREFAHELARVLRRPAWMPLPAFAIKALFGEMGRELLLASSRVIPKKLLDAGFSFSYPTLGQALEAILRRGECG